MRLQRWFSFLGIGTLVLSGTLVTSSLSRAQDATPAAGSAAQTAAEDNGKPVVGTPLLEPAIDLTRAQEIALEGHSGAAIAAVELGGENGVLAYSVTLDSGMEVDIDATSGEVISSTEQDDEHDEDQDHDYEDRVQKDSDSADEDEDEDEDDDDD